MDYNRSFWSMGGSSKLVIVTMIIAIVGGTVVIRLIGLRNVSAFLVDLGYLGAFISGLVGTSSLMISILPPQVVVFILSDPALGLDPLITGVVAGIGAGIGQYTHYYIGEGGRYIIPDKYVSRIDGWRPKLEKYGAILIFLFAATPLTPDDVIWIPLGMMRYPKRKALAASILGKTLMLVIFAYGGRYSLKIIRSWLHF
ncbi:MAG: VTT domain-containing protein [Candidatus Bathyarchaeia archaeon]